MARMYEKHRQTSRAMQIYNNHMDPEDPAVQLRRNHILHAAALTLQRVFRGRQARKLVARIRGMRQVRGSRDDQTHAHSVDANRYG
jgi:hypothetical protein